MSQVQIIKQGFQNPATRKVATLLAIGDAIATLSLIATLVARNWLAAVAVAVIYVVAFYAVKSAIQSGRINVNVYQTPSVEEFDEETEEPSEENEY